MEHSDTIGAIAGALAKAQAEIQPAAKDAKNPHFNSQYADLASVWSACRAQLSKNGIGVTQAPEADGNRVTVTTLLLHSSGEWLRSSITMASKDASPQAIGSACTYGRRYGLAAMVGVAPDDDDGEGAQGRAATERPKAQQRPREQATRPQAVERAPEPVFITPEQKGQLVSLAQEFGWPKADYFRLLAKFGAQATDGLRADTFTEFKDALKNGAEVPA